jgi:tetratricopeptide (TPR) repeat protein
MFCFYNNHSTLYLYKAIRPASPLLDFNMNSGGRLLGVIKYSEYFNHLGMKKIYQLLSISFLNLLLFATASCDRKEKTPANEMINSINLKRGEIVVCGSPDKQFGSVAFSTTCSKNVQKDFDLAMALLHSFEYDESEKVFAKIIDKEPQCAMAYWGVAMSNYHLLWTPPSAAELKKGSTAIKIAQELTQGSQKESKYVLAAARLYEDWDRLDHKTRCVNYEKAMEKIYQEYPNDKEAATLYALALNASADPSDYTFKNQRKAGAILDAMYPNEPNHPGVVHYIIHTYDNPELAKIALPAARRYASVAPSSAHALHMPSHIFTRLGLWDEAIHSNLTSVSSAKCYAEETGIKGHWDEELHSLDYLMYAYLQKGENDHAKEQWTYLKEMKNVSPVNFKVAYAFAAIPSRYVLENKRWKEAANLEVDPPNFQWKDYPWQNAIIHFTRLLGSVHTGKIDSARAELVLLKTIHDTLLAQKDLYKASQVKIQLMTSNAWILFKEGNHSEALRLMNEAANLEDNTQKHPVTPGEVIPARESLGDMLLQMNKPDKALEAYEEDLKKRPNRFNGVYGAALASERSGNLQKANTYYEQLIQISNGTNSDRPEIQKAKLFLMKHKTG